MGYKWKTVNQLQTELEILLATKIYTRKELFNKAFNLQAARIRDRIDQEVLNEILKAT